MIFSISIFPASTRPKRAKVVADGVEIVVASVVNIAAAAIAIAAADSTTANSQAQKAKVFWEKKPESKDSGFFIY